MEGIRMNDWSTEVVGQYDLNIEGIRRGRGAWIIESNDGLCLLKEYRGSVKRLEFEELALKALETARSLRVDQYVRNREGELLSTASDGTKYVIKRWFSDRECNLKDPEEILSGVHQIAVLHQKLREVEMKEEWNLRSMIAPKLYEPMKKHNRELKKAKGYIREKRKKNEFELCVIESFPEFYDQAVKAADGMEALYAENGEELKEGGFLCHGNLDQHHILIGDGYTAVTEFGGMHLGLQTEDLYSFMRKVMEKHDWDRKLGEAMLDVYERVLPMSSIERECLYYLFLYPEKYWKQINFYYNTNKAWIPARNTEKIMVLKQQEIRRLSFMEKLLSE